MARIFVARTNDAGQNRKRDFISSTKIQIRKSKSKNIF